MLNLRVGLRKRECKSINELNLLPVIKESEKENTKSVWIRLARAWGLGEKEEIILDKVSSP